MRHIYIIHRWVSLICAFFFLLLCLTGLPLLFKEEISEWNQMQAPKKTYSLGYDMLWQGLEQGIQTIQAQYPQQSIKAVSAKVERGELLFRLQDPDNRQYPRETQTGKEQQIAYDVQTQALIDQSNPELTYPFLKDFMQLMSSLHVRFGLGKSGMIFLGCMCALSVLSLLSGIWLYAPLIKSLSPGVIRRQSRRTFWSDWHKFTGLVAGVWAFVLCLSGIMIVMFSMAYSSYLSTARSEAVQHLPAYNKNSAMLSPQAALQAVNQTLDNQTVIFFKMPEHNNHLYTLYIKPLKAKPDDFMGQAIFVSAYTTEENAPATLFSKSLPWYLPVTAVFVNLHTHNHTLFATKMLWSVYILITMAMIVSGIYVWSTRWKNINYSQDRPLQPYVAIKSTWAILAIFGILPLFGLVISLYGGSFEIAGAIALFLPLLIFAVLWYKNK